MLSLRHVLAAGAYAVLAAPPVLRAQVLVDEGQRVRVRASVMRLPSGGLSPPEAAIRVTGLFERRSGDSIYLRLTDPAGVAALGIDAVERFEIVRGTKSYAALGAGAGGLAGMLIAMEIYEGPACSGWECFGDAIVEASLVTLAGLVVGAGIGGIVGGLFRRDTWIRVDPALISTRTLGFGSAGLVLSVRFPLRE